MSITEKAKKKTSQPQPQTSKQGRKVSAEEFLSHVRKRKVLGAYMERLDDKAELVRASRWVSERPPLPDEIIDAYQEGVSFGLNNAIHQIVETQTRIYQINLLESQKTLGQLFDLFKSQEVPIAALRLKACPPNQFMGAFVVSEEFYNGDGVYNLIQSFRTVEKPLADQGISLHFNIVPNKGNVIENLRLDGFEWHLVHS